MQGNVVSDNGRDIADVLEGREEGALAHVLARHLVGEGAGGCAEHVVCDPPDASSNDSEPNTRKDVCVVALPGVVCPTLDLNRRKRAPRGKQNLAVRPRKGLLGSALGARGGVGEGHDDGALVVGRHGVNNLLGECPPLRADAHKTRWLEDFNRLLQRTNRGVVVCVWDLVVLQLVQPRLDDKALGVDKPALGASLRLGHALLNHLVDNQISDACPRLSSSKEQKCLVLELGALDLYGPHDACEGDRGCALNVVVEGADSVAVLLQEAEGVCVAKVLKLDEDAGIPLVEGSDDLVH
mmetsp:Transcript_5263/g.12191  ORF Transcript_5263/g.12191 Transcript_5263/m.12191 type:complete len:296 (-) Transcript_5263:321-1208(-)